LLKIEVGFEWTVVQVNLHEDRKQSAFPLGDWKSVEIEAQVLWIAIGTNLGHRCVLEILVRICPMVESPTHLLLSKESNTSFKQLIVSVVNVGENLLWRQWRWW
jgi:hypothetical protein